MDTRRIAHLALSCRMAQLRYSQNEGEIANGGRDMGWEGLLAKREQAEAELDDALREFYGPAWDVYGPSKGMEDS